MNPNLVILQLEPNGGLEVFELPGPNLDVEPVALVRDLDDLRPSKSIRAENVKCKQTKFLKIKVCRKVRTY